MSGNTLSNASECFTTLPHDSDSLGTEQVHEISMRFAWQKKDLSARLTVQPCIVRKLANGESNGVTITIGLCLDDKFLNWIIEITAKRTRPLNWIEANGLQWRTLCSHCDNETLNQRAFTAFKHSSTATSDLTRLCVGSLYFDDFKRRSAGERPRVKHEALEVIGLVRLQTRSRSSI